MNYKIFHVFLFFYSVSLISQGVKKYNNNNQVFLTVDNDVFLSLTEDKYYSSGIYIGYRSLVKEDSLIKIIKSISLNQRMFTPNNILLKNFKDYDRPYASTLSLTLIRESYKNKSYNNYSIEFGWIGPSARVGEFHEKWHEAFGFSKSIGWDFQINDSPLFNFNYTHTWSFLDLNLFDISTESNIKIGTLFNSLNQNLLLRIGTRKSLYNSAQYGANLGFIHDLKLNKPREIYLFYKPGILFNIYNSTIEGNLIGEESIHTEKANDFVLLNQFGLVISGNKFDVITTIINNTKESLKSENHTYMSINLKKRF